MQLDQEYLGNPVFPKLKKYFFYYDCLSDSSMYFISQGTNSLSLDTYVYSSIQETVESINDVLSKGRIGDAYALLRKFYDAAIINVYTILYLEDHFDANNFIVEKIENWRAGKEQIPEIRKINGYLKSSKRAKPIFDLLHSDDRYKKLRDRCNNYTHHNFYINVFLNNGKVYFQNRIKHLERFSKDLEDIFILHFSYLFYISAHYMISSDYRESVEEGLTPKPGSENFVAPFAQELFEEIINKHRPDLATVIKEHTSLNL